MKPFYATREQFMAAYNISPTSLSVPQIDRLLNSASRKIERDKHRHFYPITDAKTFKFAGGGEGFWLNADLLSLSAVTEDGTAATLSDIDLYPSQFGPPYSWIGASGETVVVTGDWGFSNDTVPAGTLAEALDDSETEVDVSDSSKVGIGDLIIVDSERMVVTDKAQLDTTANLGANLAADKSDNAVSVNDGSLLNVGEIIVIDAEKMIISEITSNTLTVVRAWHGTTLASHSSGADVFAPRTVTVERGSAGSTSATHLTSAPITRNLPPPDITELCIGEAMTSLEQEGAAYARVIGEGEGQRESGGKGIKDLRAETHHLTRLRVGAV